MLAAAAAAAGRVRRFVRQELYTGWTNVRDGGPVKTEGRPLTRTPAPAMQRETSRRDSGHWSGRPGSGAGLTVQGIALRYGSPLRAGRLRRVRRPE